MLCLINISTFFFALYAFITIPNAGSGFSRCYLAPQMIYWLIHILFLGSIAIQYFKQVNYGLSPWIYTSALILKLSAGLMVVWTFAHYFQYGDIVIFIEKANEMASLPADEYIKLLWLKSDYNTSKHPRVFFFLKFLSFFSLICGKNYWISSMYLSFISFCGTWHLVASSSKIYPKLKIPLIVCFLYLPSVVFWSSGLLKGTLAFGSLMYLVSITLKKYTRTRISITEWIFVAISAFILFKIKHYLFIAFILFIGLLAFFSLMNKSSMKLRLMAIGILLFSLVGSQFVHPYLKIRHIGQTLYENNRAIISKTDLEDRPDIIIDSPNLSSILPEIPAALGAGLFRPSLMDAMTIWGMPHKIENTILALLLVMSFLLYFKHKPKIDFPIVLSGLLIIIMLAVMLALSTPNFGSLVRYKNAFLPFLFLFVSYLPYQHFLSQKIGVMRRS